jgi:hypothetical protein
MATIDSSIAMGYRPVQIENPLNQLAAYSQIQGAQQGQQLNALKMQEYQRGLEEENKLRTLLSGGGDINSPDIVRQMYGISPTKGLEFQQKQALIKKAGLETTKLESEIVDNKLKQSRQFLDTIDPADPSAPARYLAWHEANHKDPVLGPMLTARGVTVDQSRANIDNAIRQGPQAFAALLNQSKLGVEKFAELNKPQYIQENLGGANRVSAFPGMGGVPTTVSQTNRTATPGELMTDARARERLAAELNPELIRSKAENIKLGTLAAEQSPLAPKVIAANAGKDLVGDVATQMGNSYLKLFESGGIKSTTRGAAANLAASSQSSMLGQIGGSILGTENQSERDFIKSQRPILVQGIVKATGMTASQINSNVELKNLLDAATDPDKGYETNAKNLNLINKRFGTGKNIVPEKPNLATKTPDVEALLKKYE